MPQLQNNNVRMNVNHEGNAPKSASYVEEARVIEDHRSPGLASIISSGIQNMVGNASKQLQEVTYKVSQLKAENKFNDYQLELGNLTEEYKINYKKQPSEELTAQYEKDKSSLKDKYEKDIPEFYRGEFLKRVTDIDRHNNLEFYRKLTDLERESTIMVEGLNKESQLISQASLKGDNKYISGRLLLLPQKKESLIKTFGDIEGNKIYDKYVTQVLEGIIGGKIASDKYAEVDSIEGITEVIKMSPEFSNKLSPEKIESYRKTAIAKREEMKKSNALKEQLDYFSSQDMIFKQITDPKNKMSYTQMLDLFKANKTPEDLVKVYLHLAGYNSDLLPPNFSTTGNTIELKFGTSTITVNKKELTRKKSELEQMHFRDALRARIITILDGGAFYDENLNSAENREKLGKELQEIQTGLYYGLASGLLSQSEVDSFRNQITPFISSLTVATSKNNYSDFGFKWISKKFSDEFGFNDFQKTANQVLAGNGFEDIDWKTMEKITIVKTEDGKKKEKRTKLTEDEQKKALLIRTRLYDNYNKFLEAKFQEEKNRNPAKYSGIDNLSQARGIIDHDIRKRWYKEAEIYALANLATSEYNIDPRELKNRDKEEYTSRELVNAILSKEYSRAYEKVLGYIKEEISENYKNPFNGN